MDRIIAYIYDSNYHCIECAHNRFATASNASVKNRTTDTNLVPYGSFDSEGILINRVYNFEDTPPSTSCCDCHTVITPPFYEQALDNALAQKDAIIAAKSNIHHTGSDVELLSGMMDRRLSYALTNVNISTHNFGAINVGDIKRAWLSTPPFILADGRPLLKTEYPELYSVIGNNFTPNDCKAEYFCVPNLLSERGNGNANSDWHKAFEEEWGRLLPSQVQYGRDTNLAGMMDIRIAPRIQPETDRQKKREACQDAAPEISIPHTPITPASIASVISALRQIMPVDYFGALIMRQCIKMLEGVHQEKADNVKGELYDALKKCTAALSAYRGMDCEKGHAHDAGIIALRLADGIK